MILNKLPTQETKLMLWEDHPDVKGKLDDLFWEDQRVWYKCIDERNEGIILEQAKEGQEQFGDKKKTSLEYQCLETGEFNLPIGQFPGCAPKRESNIILVKYSSNYYFSGHVRVSRRHDPGAEHHGAGHDVLRGPVSVWSLPLQEPY